MKRKAILLIPIAIIFLVTQIPNSEGKLNLEDTSFISNDGNVVIDFGKNVKLQSSASASPTIDFVIVRTDNQNFFFDFLDNVSVKVYGDSFVIKALEKKPLLIYAHNTGGNDYSVNMYTVENGFKKHSFTGTLEPISSLESLELDKPVELKIIETLPEMKLLVKHTDRVFWTQSYSITARIFDAELNSLNEFDQNWGYIPGIDILVEIFNQDDELLTSMSGKTGNTGYFEDQFYIVENLIPRAEYIVNVTANNGQVKLTKTLPMFIMGQRPSGGGNSTGP